MLTHLYIIILAHRVYWDNIQQNVIDLRLVKFAIALYMCSCDSFSHVGCRATFNLAVVLDFGWSLWYFSMQRGAADVIVYWVQIWRLWGYWLFSMNPGQFACSLSYVRHAYVRHAVANFTKRLTACAAVKVATSSIPISATTKSALCRATQTLPEKTMFETFKTRN